jgi:hypothetical protein
MNLDRKEVTVKNLSFQKNSKNLLFFFFFCLLEQSYIFVEHDFSPSGLQPVRLAGGWC